MDERRIGRMAAEHLLSQGFGNFAYCGVHTLCSRQREEGFHAAIVEADRPPPVVFAGTGSDRRATWKEVNFRRVLAWLSRLQRPIGILAHNDWVASLVIDVAMKLKLAVPQQCAVVGIDNDEVACETAVVPLSSVDLDLPAMGYAAAKLLDSLLHGHAPPPTAPVIPPRGVVLRASSNVLAFNDPDVRTAVRLIRERGGANLTTPQLAEMLAISPRSLQRKFVRETHRPPRVEIRQARLAKVCALLAETDLPLRELAMRAGYSALPQLCVIFKKEFGVTLATYRRNLWQGGQRV
jgi:LacI family transcriptional regulator